MPVEDQIIIIYATTGKYLLDIEVGDVGRFEGELIEFIKTKYPEVPKNIREKKIMDEETEGILKKAIEECKAQFR
jgi:F-type H+-transporting ATPase subunit alpha